MIRAARSARLCIQFLTTLLSRIRKGLSVYLREAVVQIAFLQARLPTLAEPLLLPRLAFQQAAKQALQEASLFLKFARVLVFDRELRSCRQLQKHNHAPGCQRSYRISSRPATNPASAISFLAILLICRAIAPLS